MIKIETQGTTGLLVSNIQKTPAAIDHAAHTGLQRGLQSAVGVAGTQFLTGPRPLRLGVRSGRLRGSVTFEIQALGTAGPTASLVGRMGSNVKYAAFHEFGFHGIENVKAHSRVLKQFSHSGTAIDTRKPLIDRATGKVIGFDRSRKSASASKQTGFVTFGHVRAHTRRINYSGRPFIKPALEKSLPVIEREINAEIAKITPQSGSGPL